VRTHLFSHVRVELPLPAQRTKPDLECS